MLLERPSDFFALRQCLLRLRDGGDLHQGDITRAFSSVGMPLRADNRLSAIGTGERKNLGTGTIALRQSPQK